MRAAGEQFSVGERVAFYRRRRGLTQQVLAELVGRSEDWLSKIERDERELRRIDMIAALASALRVTVGDLLGQPILVEDQDDHRDDVPAVRAALMNFRRLSPTLFGSATVPNPPPTQSAPVMRLLAAARDDYEAGRLGRVIAALPTLITSAQTLEAEAETEGYALSARVHHLAASTLTKVGESDLAWMAAERAMSAAESAGEPLAIAAVARSASASLLAVGRFADALELGTQAARWVEQQLGANGMTDPAAISLTGMLYLRSAEAAARLQDRQTATELLQRAASAAQRLGRDANYWRTNFGPTNVALHRVAIGLDLDDIQTVLDFGPQIDAAAISAERSATYRVDMARAYSSIAQDSEALDYLLTAEQEAPQLVWHSALARETVRGIYRRAAHQPADLITLAERCRAIA